MGLMWEVLSGSKRRDEVLAAHAEAVAAGESVNRPPTPRVQFRWGVVDVLEVCEPERPCAKCGLEPECTGRAKRGVVTVTVSAGRAEPRGGEPAGGHIPIDDALSMKERVSASAWESEMLCLRPKRDDAVLPEFDEGVHVFGSLGDELDGPPTYTAPEAADVLAPVRVPVTRAPGRGEGEVEPGGCLVAGMDFGFRAPTVILWARVDESGVARVVRESVTRGVKLERHVALLRGDGGLGRVKWVGVDPAGNARHEQTGRSNVTAMREAGLTVRSRRSVLHEGLALVRARLAPATGGEPRLLIHRRCQQLIEAMHRYRYPEHNPATLEPKKDGFDHAVDALRYLVLNLDRPVRVRNSDQAG